jgi:hypothetical protein
VGGRELSEGERKPRRLGTLAWTAVVAAVALASGLTGLVFDLWPGLKPDPRTKLSGEVSVFAVDPSVSYGEYLKRTSFSDTEFQRRSLQVCDGRRTCNRLALPGEQIYINTTVEGFKRRAVILRLSLYRAATHRRVAGISDVDVARENLDAPTDRAVVPVWLICPPQPWARYFVRVELYHRGDNVLLAVGDSKPFKARCY